MLNIIIITFWLDDNYDDLFDCDKISKTLFIFENKDLIIKNLTAF